MKPISFATMTWGWGNSGIGKPYEMPGYLERLRLGLMAFTWKGVLTCLIVPILVLACEFVINLSTVVVEVKVLAIHEPKDPGDPYGHRDLRHLVEFEETDADGQKKKDSLLVEDDQVQAGEVAVGKPLSLLYNPRFAGNCYRSNQPISRWIFSVVAGLIYTVFLILAAAASLVREYKWARSS